MMPTVLSSRAVVLGELIDQRALARSGRAGEAENAGLAAVREKRLQAARRIRAAIFNGADGARKRARIASAHPVYQGVRSEFKLSV